MSFVTSWGTMEHLIMVVQVLCQGKPVVMNNYHAIHVQCSPLQGWPREYPCIVDMEPINSIFNFVVTLIYW